VLTSRPVLRTGVVIAWICFASAARANPAGEVPTSDQNAHFHLDYDYEIESALITRDEVGDPNADPLGPVPNHRDLEFHQYRHVITPTIELGVSHAPYLIFSVPIVIAQARELSLASGVDHTDSTTIRDGFLPANGFDARDPSAGFAGNLVFRDVSRTGVPELRAGIGYAPMIQRFDDTKPTWKLGALLHIAVGKVMRFDAQDPSSEKGISTGVHELELWTTVDRRFQYTEGWFRAFWRVPIYERDASLYKDPGFGATNVDPGQVAGVAFGAEGYLLDDTANGNKISVDLGARVDAHFEGRGYTEMWQVFALAGDARTHGPLVLDSDPTTPGVQAMSHPGISNYENYLETAGKLAIRAKLGQHVQFAATGELAWRTDHEITFADAGVDLPTCPTHAPRCEDNDNDLINPGTAEVNPLHAAKIDLVGHRYHAQDGRSYVVGVEVLLAF